MNSNRFVSVALLGLSCSFSAEAQDTRQLREPVTHDERTHARQVRDRDGLQAAASLFGKYVQEEPPSSNGVAMNVRVLAELSDIVVLATACGDMAAVSADRQHITTEYQMRIERAFSGEPQLKPGDMLDVSLPGGRVVFSDGSSVEGWTRDLALMEPGRKYLLFLKAVDSPAPEAVAARIGARGRYVPTMGSQGMFDITGTSANGVVPMGRQDTPVAYELSTLGASEAAIRRVQNAADSLHRERLAKEPR